MTARHDQIRRRAPVNSTHLTSVLVQHVLLLPLLRITGGHTIDPNFVRVGADGKLGGETNKKAEAQEIAIEPRIACLLGEGNNASVEARAASKLTSVRSAFQAWYVIDVTACRHMQATAEANASRIADASAVRVEK
jgi:hypothetical protein